MFPAIPPHEAHLRERALAKKTFTRLYLALFLFLIFVNGLLLALQLFMISYLGEDSAYEIFSSPYFAYSVQVLFMYVLGFPFFLLLCQGLPRAVYEKKSLGLGSLIIYFMICWFIMTAGASLSTTISTFIYTFLPGGGTDSGVIDGIANGVPLWLSILLFVVLAPIFEELMFRKLLIDRMSVFGDGCAIAVSAIAFGIFHGNIEQMIYAAGIGVILGIVYTKTRQVKYTIFLHMAVNFLGSIPSLLINDLSEELISQGENYDLGLSIALSSISIITVILQLGLTVAGLVMLCVWAAKGKITPQKRYIAAIRGGTLAKATVFNFGALLFFAFCLFEICYNVYTNVILAIG